MSTDTSKGECMIPTLILFVSGDAPRSNRARGNLATALKSLGKQSTTPLEVDVLAQPEQTLTYSVFATPALLQMDDDKKVSLLYGDLSEEKILLDFLRDL